MNLRMLLGAILSAAARVTSQHVIRDLEYGLCEEMKWTRPPRQRRKTGLSSYSY